MEILFLAIAAGVIALAFAAYLAWNVTQSDEGNEQVRFIGNAIREGAMAFLSREYRLLAIFVIVVFVILWIFRMEMLANNFNYNSVTFRTG